MRIGKRLKSLYRLDSVPLLLRPLHYIYGYVLGMFAFLYVILISFTSKVDRQGLENLHSYNNKILCLWHENWWTYLATRPRHQKHIWLVHPPWYMYPAVILFRFFGIKLHLLGSSGEEGRRAADQLVDYLKAGWSTGLAPDGPEGPSKQLKRGVLHIAQKSNVVIVPVQLSCSNSIRLGGWDRAILPLPCGKVTICYKQPIRVTLENFQQSEGKLVEDLG